MRSYMRVGYECKGYVREGKKYIRGRRGYALVCEGQYMSVRYDCQGYVSEGEEYKRGEGVRIGVSIEGYVQGGYKWECVYM